MDFFQKYQLIESLPGEGTKSFRARQTSTGNEVVVHLLIGGRTPENQNLLARLRAIPTPSFANLIEVGDNEGTPIVVTAAPPHFHLEDCLDEQERSALSDSQKLARAGKWKVPGTPQITLGAQPAAEPSPTVAEEFLHILRTGRSPTHHGPVAPPPQPPGDFSHILVTGKTPTQQSAGEFSNILVTGKTPTQEGPAAAAPARQPAPPLRAPQPPPFAAPPQSPAASFRQPQITQPKITRPAPPPATSRVLIAVVALLAFIAGLLVMVLLKK